ncbi:MAG: SIR2 family protein [Bdellovibrionales bacterium]
MIDPIHSLAFSLQANRGVYAVLLGSGISRSARIPTGWEITLDLVRKLSTIYGEICEPSPEQWYCDKFGHEPDYSQLLDAIAKTPAERQQLLRSYWEANDSEREEGAKQPTAAHKAIASLVERGFIKVIITTNFDRLMETALADVGITPTVLSSPDQVHGALPLIHTRCCLFKVHGDYLDTRIRNTPEELAEYPDEFNQILDRILDEFGLIVCGWSAEWDEALRRAIMRTPSRRFAYYWAVYGRQSGTAAQQLIEQRGAHVIDIAGADSFFQTLQQQVQSLEEFSKPHPLSTEAAVASLKRYLSESKYRIQLVDLVNNEVERILEATSDQKFAFQGGPGPNAQSFNARVKSFEVICDTLLAMATTGGFWAEEPHYYVWERALSVLAENRPFIDSGYTLWIELQRYPACLLFYTLGLGALEAKRLNFLSKLFTVTIRNEYREDKLAIQHLPALCLFERGTEPAKLLNCMERRHVPLNDWLQNVLKPYMKRIITSESHFELIFDKLEILMALSYAYRTQQTGEYYWAPLGSYGYRHINRDKILKEIEASLSRDGENSIYVISKIFGETLRECTDGLTAFQDFIKRSGRMFW